MQTCKRRQVQGLTVLLREIFLFEAKKEKTVQDYGRAFNHPEHLVFFYGVEGTLEALQHFEEIVKEKPGKTSVRKKWDGAPQIYWGRETANGPLILAGHNGWARGAKSTNQEDVYNFIATQSGNPKTEQEAKERQAFATQFANLYPLFDAATPKDFVGFVYADNLFGVDPARPKTLQNGVYTFCPNPKSKTCYHVNAESELGQRVAQAQVMVVAHAYFPTFGAGDREQQPIDDFSMFNTTPGLIVQGPIYVANAPVVDTTPIKDAMTYANQHAGVIDGFLSGISPQDKNGIFYPFANYLNKTGQFASASSKIFLDWMTQKGVSKNKQQNIINQIQANPGGLDAIFHLMTQIRTMKDAVDAAIKEQDKPEIWDSHGEGHVRYAQKHHKFGNIKLVPTSWTP